MYYAEKLREKLTDEARGTARKLIGEFETALKDSGVQYGDYVKEGVPFERILEDMKYHDLLVVGNDPHFFYNRPKQQTETLARLVKETVAPTLVVTDTYHPVDRVLIAYDGSTPAARTMQRFANLQPFGTEVAVEVLTIHDGDDTEAQLLLDLAGSYLKAHGFETKVTAMRGDDDMGRQIVDHAEQSGADVVVAGAHAVSKIERLMFGSTTAALLKHKKISLFLHN